MPTKSYLVDEEGNIVFHRLEWGVRQYKSFVTLPEAQGHLKVLVAQNPRALESGYRITCHTIEVIESVDRDDRIQI